MLDFEKADTDGNKQLSKQELLDTPEAQIELIKGGGIDKGF